MKCETTAIFLVISLSLTVISSVTWAADVPSSLLLDRSRRYALSSTAMAMQRNPVNSVAHRRSIRRPGNKLILLILRERCQQWMDKDINPLPAYCFFLVSRHNTVDND